MDDKKDLITKPVGSIDELQEFTTESMGGAQFDG